MFELLKIDTLNDLSKGVLELFQQSFLPRFLKIAAINIASTIMIPLSGAISVAFLGHLASVSYLAGVALCAILFDLIYESCSFVKSGATVMTAQIRDPEDREQLILAGLQNVLIAVIIGISFLALKDPIIRLYFMFFDADEDVKLAGISYFNSRIWGAPAALVNLALIGWLLGREQNGKVLILTLVGNISNIVLDYFYIVLLGWSSMGAGLSQAISQYIVLFLTLGSVIREFSLKDLSLIIRRSIKLDTFKGSFNLNRDLSVRSIVVIAIFVLFETFGSTLGTAIITENILLLQVVAISMYMCIGVEYATMALAGNFQGQGEKHNFLPLLQVSLGANLTISLLICLAVILFPFSILGIFTSNLELIKEIENYIPWASLIALGLGVTCALDGYFAGLCKVAAIRNTYLISGFLGSISLILSAFYFHNNHFLWLSLIVFLLSSALSLGAQIPMTLQPGDSPEALIDS